MRTIKEILSDYEVDTSTEAYEASQMVQMLRNREVETPSFLDKYEQS